MKNILFVLLILPFISSSQDTTIVLRLIVREVWHNDTVSTIVNSQVYDNESLNRVQKAINEQLDDIKVDAILPKKIIKKL